METEMSIPPAILRKDTTQTLGPVHAAACQNLFGKELEGPGTGKTFTTVTKVDEVLR